MGLSDHTQIKAMIVLKSQLTLIQILYTSLHTPHNNAMTALNTFIIEPKQPANACVIWMHGLGANAHDFEDIVPQLQLDPNHHVRFVFPNAPVQPITINMGQAMPAWYDIYHLDRIDHQDRQGIEASSLAIDAIINHQINQGIAAERIVLAGFSQGGAMALHTGLRFHQSLAGIMALSTYLPLSDLVEQQAHNSNKTTPILMIHGRHDPVLPMMLAEMSCMQLKKLGYPVDWQDYPMAHEVCWDEVKRISQWLNRVF